MLDDRDISFREERQLNGSEFKVQINKRWSYRVEQKEQPSIAEAKRIETLHMIWQELYGDLDEGLSDLLPAIYANLGPETPRHIIEKLRAFEEKLSFMGWLK
jgi:hypothetical protein